MKINVINFGYEKLPVRKHANDAGADVHVLKDYVLEPHTTTKIPLGFGLKVPDGYAAFIFPRSGLSAEGIVCELPPIDSGYRGEVHAIVSNLSDYSHRLNKNDRVGQIVITPIVIAEFTEETFEERGAGAFASTGR